MREVQELLNQKENLILEITNRLINWDNSVDDAISILEGNDRRFHQMKKLDLKIPDDQLMSFNERYKEHWLRILNLQQELMKKIEEEKIYTQEQLSQIDNKQKVVSNYIALKNKSIFIEKDY